MPLELAVWRIDGELRALGASGLDPNTCLIKLRPLTELLLASSAKLSFRGLQTPRRRRRKRA